MHVYIVADMEGIVNQEQVSLGTSEFQEGRALLAGDVNAAIAGACDAGATRVVVNDFHDTQRNFYMERMDSRAEYEVTCGSRLPALDRGFAALVIVGMHAMSGTPRAFLEHAADPAWHRYTINGVQYGEIAQMAFAAAAFDVPTVFVSGDRAAVDEARSLAPAVEGVVVKEGLGRRWRRSLAPAIAHESIRDGVRRTLEQPQAIMPPQLDFPVAVCIEFNRCDAADHHEGQPGVRRLDGFTIEWTADHAGELRRI